MKNKLRLHLIGCARNASTPLLTMDPYAMISYYTATYLHRAGHEVHYYGYKESTVECTKQWECGDRDFLLKNYVTDYKTNHWKENPEANLIFFNKAKNHLLTNYKEGDIIICNWSPCVDILRPSFPNAKIVDGNINHRHPSGATNYHVHSSVANQHILYGKDAQRLNVYDREGYWHDTVIYPMANELSNFEFKKEKEDYFFFMARLGWNKGISILRDLAEHFPNEKFIIAGQGKMPISLLPNMKFVGCLNGEEKKVYLSNAKAIISPSFYAEPFGLTPIEAGLSGTPTICTDWGGYTENVIDGVTGFRCTYFYEFVDAINNISSIKPEDCRKFSERFAAETLIKDWEKYLHKIARNSWYDLDRSQETPEYLERRKIQADNKKWFSDQGDFTHNVNCDLTEDSIVFDVGGYAGDWAEKIYNKYKCTIYVFEPVKEFYDNIVKRFKGNDKIKVFHIGLGDKTYTTDIKLTEDLVGTSVYRETNITGKIETVKIVDIIEFMKEHKLKTIDLLKLNIEGEEFPLLEHLIKNNKLKSFNNLKIQFHNFMESAAERKENIRLHLQKEFELIYDYFFVWEGWKRKNL